MKVSDTQERLSLLEKDAKNIEDAIRGMEDIARKRVGEAALLEGEEQQWEKKLELLRQRRYDYSARIDLLEAELRLLKLKHRSLSR